MITYSTNWMGPINTAWIEEHGPHWCSGRIDVYGTDNPYPEEIGLPLMNGEDWYRFSRWISTISTETVWSLDQLVEEYGKIYGPIRWFKKK